MARNRISLIAVTMLLSGLLLTGCSTMDAAKCESLDWQARGARDAERGRKRESVSGLARTCQEFAVKADTQAYYRGWDAGIEKYCTREKGWEEGMSAVPSYNQTCPDHLEAEFYSAYQLARSVKDSRTEVANVRRDLDKVLEKLAEGDLEQDKRLHLKKEKKRLKGELASAKSEEAKAVREARDMGFSI